MRLILVIGLLAASGSPGLPASTMTVDGNHVKYCVSGYAPDRPVTIVEERIDLTVRVRTHIDGSVCTHLPARSVCGQVIERSAVATGIGADGNPVGAKSLEQGAEQMRPGRGQQPHRRQMTAGAIGGDDIGGIGVVEAVDLKPVVNDGQIPVEQVDEQPLAVLEHGFEQRLIGRRAEPFDDMDH